MGTKNFANMIVGVPISETMGFNGGNPFLRGLCTLVGPYSVPGFEPTGLSLS